MKKQTNWRMRATVGILVTSIPYCVYSQDDEDREVFELSPFTVEATDNEGYRATTTLAGSRIRSNISDLGSSISVVTSEFLQDTGATDGESLLSYVGNVEVGGTQGNFSNVNLTNESTNESRNNPQRGQRVRGLVSATLTRDYFQTDIPFDSYNTERVTVNRGPNSVLFGLGSPGGIINNTTKRAYIDAADSTNVSFRVDHRGSFRANFDIARTLIEDRLAIRVAGLHENQNYKQDPAFTEDNRLYFAWNATLFKNENSNFLGRTSLRGSFEKGSIDSNPPDVVPPTDGFSSWWQGVGSQAELNQLLTVPGVDFTDIGNGAVTEAQVRAAVAAGLAEVPEGQTLDDWAQVEGRFIPQTTVDRFERGIAGTNNGGRDNINFFTPYFIYPAINYNSGSSTQIGWNDPALSGIDGIMARWRPNGFSGPRDLVWSSPATGGAGFSLTSVDDRNIFDYHNRLFQGTSNEVLTDFDLYNAVIEQELFNGRAGIELAFDRQERYQSRFNPFSSATNKRISIDISEYHASGDANLDGVADGFFNENLGRPVVRWDDNPVQREWTDQDTFRATVFATLDFNDFMSSDRWGKMLGEHTVTGLYEDRTNDRSFRQTRGAWWADTGDYPGERFISNGANDNFRRIVKSQVYLGPSGLGLSSPDQLRIEDTIQTGFPEIGETYRIWYWDDAANEGVINDWRIIEALQNADVSRRELTSEAFTLQSKFFDGNLVGMWARRSDEQNSIRRLQRTEVRGPTGSLAERIEDPGNNETDGNFNEALLFLEDTPFAVDEDSTTTWSVVAKYPENWLGELPFGMDASVHYYEAESFQPGGGQVNVLNQPLASPFGTTNEKGITLTFGEGKFSLRYNEYKTVNAFARTNLEGGLNDVIGRPRFFINRIAEAEESGLPLFPDGYSPDPNVTGDYQDFFDNPGDYTAAEGSDASYTIGGSPSNRQRATGTDADLAGVASYDAYYDLLISILPPEVQSIYNFSVERNPDGTLDVLENPLNGSLQSTNDFVSSGKEIDLVGRLTDNISISMNLAQQKTVTSNTGPIAIPLAEEIMQNIIDLGLYEIRDSPFQTEQGAVGASRYEGTLRTLRTARAKDGTQSPEQREWRANATLRYDFLDGKFKGFSIGGSLRYQDEIAVGYPNIIDADGIVRPDVSNPWFGPDEINGDLLLRYRRPLSDGKIDWSVQLNARNLYRSNGNDDIPVTINPDGRVGIIRIPNERQFFITNTFSF